MGMFLNSQLSERLQKARFGGRRSGTLLRLLIEA
jgi:hypothetical protein